ncbi:MAG: hypothetical protein BGO49_13950 [Planctomycetales bacterium 71-10]|nr:MAG: hypothetical protein BGO49_13950 [Planctomycetales bacterium 71-10]
MAQTTRPRAAAPLFDADFIQKLEYLSLVSRRVFRGRLMAQRRTTQLGGGVEFADHREYTPGDDFRHLDWNLFARHDELLLKRFQEEEDLHVYILLDCSRSMAFGDPSKFDYARRIAAAMAYIALAELDRVAVSAFAGGIFADFPLTRGKARILSLLQFLEGLPVQDGPTDLARAARDFALRSRRRGLVIVVSDLFDPEGFERGLDVIRHNRHEPHVVQVYDRREAEPEVKGDLELFDVESGAIEKVTVAERNLQQYRAIFAEFLESVQRYCKAYGIGGTCSPTQVPFDDLILKMMRQTGAVA